jgi:hypothetical protein
LPIEGDDQEACGAGQGAGGRTEQGAFGGYGDPSRPDSLIYFEVVMKTLMVLAMVFFAHIAQVVAESRFNALDSDDPHYAAYQVGLCQGVYAQYQHFYSERFWLDHESPKLDLRTEEQRQDWVGNYVIATELRDRALHAFNTHCL